jgi:ribosomal protein L3 glutamine methyltransferase
MNNEQQFTANLELAQSEFSTLRDWLRFMVSAFNQFKLAFGHGTNNAYDEAIYLLLHTLNLPLDNLEPFLDAKLLAEEKAKLAYVCRQRVIERLPVPYVTHEAFIQNYAFYVDKRVIIPRSFIAEIILAGGLDELVEHTELVHNVLDLCTGNASLAVIAANHFYDSQVVAADIDLQALEVAKINIERYRLEDCVSLVQSDLFTELANYQHTFDLILTNPPYVDDIRMQDLPPEYLHEPKIALSGGSDGLVLIDKILKQASQYLSPEGILIVEMGDNKSELEERYPEVPFNWFDNIGGEGLVFSLTKDDLDCCFGI